jgi:hypothetical protein
MGVDLPRPVSTDQHFYAHIADLLAEQNDLLRQLVADRQAVQAEPDAPDTTDEPETPQVIDLREPEPATPKVKVTSTRRRTAAKKEN